MKGSKVGLYLVLAFAGIALFGTAFLGSYEWWPQAFKNPITMQSGILAGSLIFIALFLAQSLWSALKGKSNILVTHSERFHVNPNDGAHVAGKFVCRRLGGVNVPSVGISLRGEEGTIIFPEAAMAPYGDTYLVRGVAKRRPFAELPNIVRDTIRQNFLPPPYFLVMAPKYIETRGGDYTAEERLAVQQNAQQHYLEASTHRTVHAMDQTNRVLARQVQNGGKSRVRSFFDKWKEEDPKHTDDPRAPEQG